MSDRFVTFALWLCSPLMAWCSRMSVARMEQMFDQRGPIGWREVFIAPPAEPCVLFPCSDEGAA